MSAINYADLLKMSHIMLEEITVQSIGTINALCIQMRRNLFTHHRDEFPCHNLFGRPPVSHPHIIGLLGTVNQASTIPHSSRVIIVMFA